jgi:hypothetical protein
MPRWKRNYAPSNPESNDFQLIVQYKKAQYFIVQISLSAVLINQ